MHQRKNGSLFNSPTTTSAALFHTHDDKCFQYLDSVLKSFNGWVPTIYPFDAYTQLCAVDAMKRLGIDRYFSHEIGSILDNIYRSWKGKDEEIFSDIDCLAMAFRLLRMKGYHASSVAAKACVEQDLSVKDDLVSMWLELLMIFAREIDEKGPSTLDEYLSYAWKSVAVHLRAMTSILFFGNKLSEDIFTCPESISLCKHASFVCRLLNDLKTLEKEHLEGKLNSVTVQIVTEGISEEEAILNVKEIIEYNQRKVLQMVYQSEGSVFPRKCRELFWKSCKIGHCLYEHDGSDELSSPWVIGKELNALVWNPLELPRAR